jgi:hypothetical protein
MKNNASTNEYHNPGFAMTEPVVHQDIESIDLFYKKYKLFFWTNLCHYVKLKSTFFKCKHLFQSNSLLDQNSSDGEELFNLLFARKKQHIIQYASKHMNIDQRTTLFLCFRFNNIIINNLRSLYIANNNLSQTELLNICKNELFKSKIEIDISNPKSAGTISSNGGNYHGSNHNRTYKKAEMKSRITIGYIFIAVYLLVILAIIFY